MFGVLKEFHDISVGFTLDDKPTAKAAQTKAENDSDEEWMMQLSDDDMLEIQRVRHQRPLGARHVFMTSRSQSKSSSFGCVSRNFLMNFMRLDFSVIDLY